MNTPAGTCRPAVIRRWRGACGVLAGATLFATTALAQPIAAAAPVESSPRATGELGRLFFTPEERHRLERQRDAKTEEKPVAAPDPTLTIDGVVTRSSGKRTVWINGAAHNDGEQPDGVAIGTNRRAPGQVVVRPEGAPPIPARVGDTVDRTAGEAGGALGKGSLTTRSTSSR